MKDNYENDFEIFLSHTDEKQILLAEIFKEIERNDTKSILDIGAGNGLLSIPLSQKVINYLAIEQSESFVKKLLKAGVKVIKGIFPVKIDEVFDMVLVCHSIEFTRDLFEPFIRKAWRSVKPGGVFLLVTYRGQEDDWTRLMKDLGDNRESPNRIGFNKIVELLFSLGEVKMRKVTTQVKTDKLDDMVQAVAFVASDGRLDKKEKFLKNRLQLEKILERKYHNKHGYSFPFQHFFVITRRML